MTKYIAFMFIIIATLTSRAMSGGSTAFTYQGRLLDAGEPANGTFVVQFRLFDDPEVGSQIGSTATFKGLEIVDGLFTVEIDFAAIAFDNSDRWLEVSVNGATLDPRQPITRAPYSIQTRGIFVDEDQDVGIGTTSPTSPLHVRLAIPGQAVRIESTDPANNFTALGVTHNGSGSAVLAWNSGTGHAGEFRVFNPNNAAAVRGLNQGGGNAGLFEINNTNNSAPSIYAETNGDSGIAVFGLATATSGLTTFGGRFESDLPGGQGVLGRANASTGGGIGVHGRSDSNEGRGVFGHASSNSGNTTGGYFQSDSTNGRGVFGWNPSTTGNGRGVVGQSNSNNGRGVYGTANSSTGFTYGVYGLSQSNNGRGVLGIATSPTGVTYGVLGETLSTTASAVGVYGLVSNLFPGANSAAVRGENRGTLGGGIGVWGSHDGSGWGVNGVSTNGIAVRGFGGSFDFYAAGPGTNYGSGSSIRWKSNIRNIDQPLEKVSRLRGVYFNWDKEHGGHHDVGMIAEEVGEVLPEIVNYEKNGIDAIGMDYSKLTPLLVEAVNALNNELQSARETHRQELARLSRDYEVLRERLSNLESIVHESTKQENRNENE